MENNQHRDVGSTALTAALVGEYLLVVNVGDSWAVLYRSGKAFFLSRHHKPNQTDEQKWIEDDGGFVIWVDKKDLFIYILCVEMRRD